MKVLLMRSCREIVATANSADACELRVWHVVATTSKRLDNFQEAWTKEL